MLLTGVALGVAFLAKELQAFLVIPGFALVYLVAAPGGWWRRVRQGVVMAGAMALSAGWWIAIATLTPAADRPYIGGSQNNSFWNVLFGYNGLGRLSGNETGSVGAGGNGQIGRWGATGWTRMFNSQFGGEASWLLPTALALLAIGLVVTIRRSRTDRTRAALIIWGGWLLVTGIAFSLGQGIIHEYYAVALAPAIGALVGIGSVTLWRARAAWWARIAMLATWVLTVWWVRELLARSPNWHQHLRDGVVVGAVVVGVALLVPPTRRWVAGLTAGGALLVALAAPAAASVTTARTPHQGPLPTSGPAVANRGFGGRPGGFGPTGNGLPQLPAAGGFPGGTPPSGGGFLGGAPTGGVSPVAVSLAVASPVAASPVGAPRAVVGASSDRRPPARKLTTLLAARPIRWIPMGRRDDRRHQRCRHAARVGSAHHGDRWVQRLRPHADPRRVPALRRERRGALFHRHQLRRSRRRPEWHREHDFGVGAVTLRLAYRRWCHHL